MNLISSIFFLSKSFVCGLNPICDTVNSTGKVNSPEKIKQIIPQKKYKRWTSRKNDKDYYYNNIKPILKYLYEKGICVKQNEKYMSNNYNIDEILRKVKALPKPLACYIYTESGEEKRKMLNELSFGGGANVSGFSNAFSKP